MEIKVKNNQSVVDIAIQETGTVEGVWDVLKLNARTNLELDQGTVLKTPLPIQPGIVDFFKHDPAKPILAATMGVMLEKAAAVQVKAQNSSGDIISTKTVTSTDNVIGIPNTFRTLNGVDFLELPSATSGDISLVDQNGTTIVPDSISAGQIVVTKHEGWQRPKEWPAVPSPKLPDSLYYLIEHLEGCIQTFQIMIFGTAPTPASVYIDGVFVSNITPSVELLIDIDPSQGFTYLGRKWSWLRVHIPYVGEVRLYTNSAITNPNSNKSLNVVEIINTVPAFLFLYLDDTGAGYRVLKNSLQHFDYGSAVIANGSNTFRSNRFAHISNMPSFTSVYGMFYAANYVPGTLDCSGATQLASTLGLCTATSVHFINTSSIIQLNSITTSSSVREFTMSDCAAVTTTLNAFNSSRYLQRVILPNLKVSVSFSNCISMTRENLLEMIDSLANRTGFSSPVLTLTNIPAASHPAVLAAATAKNWTITY